MQVIGVIIYFAVGLVQLAAIMSGFESWWGLNSIVAFILAFITTYIPILGQIVGMAGAMKGWGWEWWQAALLFFGAFALTFGLGGAAMVIEKFRR